MQEIITIFKKEQSKSNIKEVKRTNDKSCLNITENWVYILLFLSKPAKLNWDKVKLSTKIPR